MHEEVSLNGIERGPIYRILEMRMEGEDSVDEIKG